MFARRTDARRNESDMTQAGDGRSENSSTDFDVMEVYTVGF